MKRRFVNRFVNLVALCAVCAIALVPTFAMAGGKGKSDRSTFSLSNGGNGGGGDSGGGGSPSMKLHASRSKSLSSFGLSGNGGDNGNSGHITSKKLTTDSSLSGINRRSRKPSFTLADQHNLADAVQAGKFKPMDSGIGNGTGGGTIKWPGKFTTTDNGTIADSLKKHKFFPVDDMQNGGQNGPGDGDGKGPGKGKGKGKNKDCDFPWWQIVAGGCYNGGGCYDGGNCHHHHDCYDNYHGGCYTPVVTYPSVTNIIIDGPAVDPAAATLVAGVDLELLDVRLVDGGDAAKNLGQRYRLTFGNRGTLPAGNFQVMLMATADGTPQPGAPSAASEISGLASRQVLTADVRLPLAADLATMTKFIVVVDSAAQIGEPDENNNVAVLDRAKIATVDATAVAVQ